MSGTSANFNVTTVRGLMPWISIKPNLSHATSERGAKEPQLMFWLKLDCDARTARRVHHLTQRSSRPSSLAYYAMHAEAFLAPTKLSPKVGEAHMESARSACCSASSHGTSRTTSWRVSPARS